MPDLEQMALAETCRNAIKALRPVIFGEYFDPSVIEHAQLLVDEMRQKLHRIYE